MDGSRILAEVLRLQRWAGGDSVDAAQIFGLFHGFETVHRQATSRGISEVTQNAVEDVLDDIENGKQSADGLPIKNRLHRDGIDETDAWRVIQLCQLQSRFTDAIHALASGRGSIFPIDQNPKPNSWFGASHYIELIEETEEGEPRRHAIRSPEVPRVGEIITPQSGTSMRVVSVEYVAIPQEADLPVFVPHVTVEPEE